MQWLWWWFEFSSSKLTIAAAVAFTYIALVSLARWWLIASPTKATLHSQILAVKQALTRRLAPDAAAPLDGLLTEAKNLLTRDDERVLRVVWSRGSENAAWRLVHAVERELALHEPLPILLQRLRTLETTFRADSVQPAATAMASRIAGALAPPPREEGADPEPITEEQVDDLRALLRESLRVSYELRDSSYLGLITWHNKVIFMVTVASLLLLPTVALAPPAAILLAFGAVGGFVSRLVRLLRDDGVPQDYASYWTSLFLSPLLGAFAGWGGVLTVTALTHYKVLGPAFDGVQWGSGDNAATFGVAFLFGFSDVLLQRLLLSFEQRFSMLAKTAATPPAADPAAPAPEPLGQRKKDPPAPPTPSGEHRAAAPTPTPATGAPAVAPPTPTTPTPSAPSTPTVPVAPSTPTEADEARTQEDPADPSPDDPPHVPPA